MIPNSAKFERAWLALPAADVRRAELDEAGVETPPEREGIREPLVVAGDGDVSRSALHEDAFQHVFAVRPPFHGEVPPRVRRVLAGQGVERAHGQQGGHRAPTAGQDERLPVPLDGPQGGRQGGP
jgi:hypothetical protein